jgi:hypothetical protein
MRATLAFVRAAVIAACALGLSACGSDDDGGPPVEPEPDPDPAPPPGAFLAPEAYDCTAEGPVEPPARPHPADCFADPACDGRLVAAHRMGTHFAPENSLSALRSSILLGVDIVETDIRLTADGEVVLIHDGSVDRTLQGSGDVSSFTLEELEAMPMQVDGLEGDFSCDRVPTLDATFELSRGRIVVELEVKDTQAGVLAAEYLRDEGLYDHAFLLCSRSECEAARAAVPDVPIMSRPDLPDEVAAEIDYDPPPVLVHVNPTEVFLTDPIVDSIHGVGAKIYANAFIDADVVAIGGGGFDRYLGLFDAGLDALQSEVPHYALVALGRLEPK